MSKAKALYKEPIQTSLGAYTFISDNDVALVTVFTIEILRGEESVGWIYEHPEFKKVVYQAMDGISTTQNTLCIVLALMDKFPEYLRSLFLSDDFSKGKGKWERVD